jgi:5-formyltetrahydrofolate cyclo-ligase
VDDPIADEKLRLRREFRSLRRGMAERERRARSTRMWRRVVKGLRGAGRLGAGQSVMAFHSFDDEPPTEALHQLVWDSGARLLLPRVEGSTVVPVPHEATGPLATAVLGVPEPTGPAVDAADVDTVIVPGLAFDRLGQRLGYGAGFYDRFLPQVAEDCTVLGVCLAPLLVDRLPAGPRDVPVPIVVTDEEVIRTTDDGGPLGEPAAESL